MSRVLNPLAQRGIIPQRMSCEQESGELLIEIVAKLASDAIGELVLQKIRSIALVKTAKVQGETADVACNAGA